jgi:hypothetical protein
VKATLDGVAYQRSVAPQREQSVGPKILARVGSLLTQRDRYVSEVNQIDPSGVVVHDYNPSVGKLSYVSYALEVASDLKRLCPKYMLGRLSIN